MVIYMKRILCMLCAVCLLFTLLPLRADAAGKASRFHATFLQNWLCRDWTEARWIEEFSSAKAAGFDALILQSTYDIVRGNCAAGGHPQDAAAYSDAESFCMFPSQHAATYHSSQNGGDALELALRAAKDTEMQLWIGTVNDDLWWKFGWGVPEGSYLADWSASNAALCGSLITEMWERYGDTYGEQIAGWYYVNELWNIDAACDRSDDRRYAEIIGGNIGETVRAVTACCPEKPILISPFYNPDVSTVEGFTAFLSDVLQTAAFRPIDIYAGQDGGGKEYTPAVIRAWMLAQNQAVGGKMRFWINHECFNADFTPKPIAQPGKLQRCCRSCGRADPLFVGSLLCAGCSALRGVYCLCGGIGTGRCHDGRHLRCGRSHRLPEMAPCRAGFRTERPGCRGSLCGWHARCP